MKFWREIRQPQTVSYSKIEERNLQGKTTWMIINTDTL
jgi:hypothetical protein